MLPWEQPRTEIEILNGYEAEIIGEEGEDYMIAFGDTDGGQVEANMCKKDFDVFPHPVRVGTMFGIITFRTTVVPGVVCGAWPVSKYWNDDLRKTK